MRRDLTKGLVEPVVDRPASPPIRGARKTLLEPDWKRLFSVEAEELRFLALPNNDDLPLEKTSISLERHYVHDDAVTTFFELEPGMRDTREGAID